TAATLLLRLIHADGTAVELGAVHLGHRAARSLLVGEGHEAEAARAARLAIVDDLGLGDFTEAGEAIAKAVVRSREAQTAHKQFLTHLCPSIIVGCIAAGLISSFGSWVEIPRVLDTRHAGGTCRDRGAS